MKPICKIKLLLFFVILQSVLCYSLAFAESYHLCNGREFNSRVMSFLNDADPNVHMDSTVTRFEKGNNPPADPAYYVDVSEDMDGSIIVYAVIVNQDSKSSVTRSLYWYSDSIAVINDDLAYMFNNFVSLRNVDLSGFVYLNGLHDTRYMFGNCRSLRQIKFKQSKDNPLDLTEVQGMFFNCQSLSNIDLTYFTTYLVDNMDEMFYKCYNLKNIYVNPARWNVDSVRTFNRMFSECHLLKTNDGKKAVDIAEDDYGKYAVVGTERSTGFIKDINGSYEDYGEYDNSVPVDGRYYLYDIPETTANYREEPEEDVVLTESNSLYGGDGSTGYGAEKESGLNSEGIIQDNQSITETQMTISSDIDVDVYASGASETSDSVNINETYNITESAEMTIDIAESSIDIEASEDATESGKRVVELEDYLKEHSNNTGADEDGGLLSTNIRFLLFALAISLIVILLLVGMVIYLFKDNDKNSHKL